MQCKEQSFFVYGMSVEEEGLTEMFALKKWKLDDYGDQVIARGKCYGNPRFPEGRYIHTSAIVKTEISKESEQLILTTYSGSSYRLDYAELDEEAYESTKESVKYLGTDLDLERCLWLRQQEQKKTMVWLEGILDPCELYVKINQYLKVDEAYYRTEQGEIVKMEAGCHTGMFVDSVLVGDYGRWPPKYPCNWRYMIDGGRISCYLWDGPLDAVKILSEEKDFVIEDSGREVPCKRNEICVLERL